MTAYRKRPVVIDAEQWDGTVADATRLIDWAAANGGTLRYRGPRKVRAARDHPEGEQPAALAVDTLEGTMLASPGDFIIRGVQGEHYPCKPDIFDLTYERAEADATS